MNPALRPPPEDAIAEWVILDVVRLATMTPPPPPWRRRRDAPQTRSGNVIMPCPRKRFLCALYLLRWVPPTMFCSRDPERTANL